MPAKKPASLKRIGKGPFRGPTPERVFQTIDLGSGKYANYLYGQGKKYPQRKYLAVDSGRIVVKEKGIPSLPKNVKTSSKDALRLLEQLAGEGKRARHIEIAMPTGSLLNPAYLKKIAELGTKVLLPNGKFHFVTPVDPESFKEIRKAFENSGYSFRVVPTTEHSFKKQSPKADAWQEQYGEILGGPIAWQYEFTLRLKKAIPEKAKRRNWPRI